MEQRREAAEDRPVDDATFEVATAAAGEADVRLFADAAAATAAISFLDGKCMSAVSFGCGVMRRLTSGESAPMVEYRSCNDDEDKPPPSRLLDELFVECDVMLLLLTPLPVSLLCLDGSASMASS